MKRIIITVLLVSAFFANTHCMQMQQAGQQQNQNQNHGDDIERGNELLLEAPDRRIQVCGARDLSCVAMTACSLVIIALIVGVVSQVGDYDYTSSRS